MTINRIAHEMSSEDEKEQCPLISGQQEYRMDHSDMCLMLAGFEDCAAEALRYLVVEEGFAADHPVVQGLKEHLETQKRHLDFQSVVNSYLEAMEDEDDVMDTGSDQNEQLSSSENEDIDEDDEEFLRVNYESSWKVFMQSDEFLSKLLGYSIPAPMSDHPDMLSNGQNATTNEHTPSPSPSI